MKLVWQNRYPGSSDKCIFWYYIYTKIWKSDVAHRGSAPASLLLPLLSRNGIRVHAADAQGKHLEKQRTCAPLSDLQFRISNVIKKKFSWTPFDCIWNSIRDKMRFESCTLSPKRNKPAGCRPTSRGDLKTASSSCRCLSISSLDRQSSSSYSAIVVSTATRISSTAALSRWFNKALSIWTLHILFLPHSTNTSRENFRVWFGSQLPSKLLFLSWYQHK